MNTFRTLTATVASAALLGASAVAFAGPSPESASGTAKKGCHMPKQLKQQLSQLSPEQRTAVKQALKAGREQQRNYRQQLRTQRENLNVLLQQKNVDAGKVNAAVDQISALQKQMLQTAVNTRLTIAKQSGVTFGFPMKHHGKKHGKCSGKYQPRS